METFSALLALCEGNPPVTGWFPHKGSFDVFFDMQYLSKQSRRRWFETPWRSFWRYYNGHIDKLFFFLTKPLDTVEDNLASKRLSQCRFDIFDHKLRTKCSSCGNNVRPERQTPRPAPGNPRPAIVTNVHNNTPSYAGNGSGCMRKGLLSFSYRVISSLTNSHIWQSLSLRDWRWKAAVTLGWMGATFSGSSSWPPRCTASATLCR